MRNLININSNTINNQVIQTVDARELHEILGVGTQFKDWIVRRIEEYGFVEGVDFTSFAQKRAKPQGGRSSKEYHISLNMAKELSMVERNEQGRQARQYFIKCEEVATKKLIGEQKLNNGLPEYRKAKATMMMLDVVDGICKRLPNLGSESKQVVLASLINPIAGDVIPLPEVKEKTYTATEVGEMLGISSKKVGSIANKLEIKTDEYGIYVWDKSPYSNKQVETFRYNDKAVLRIENELNS